MAAVVLGAAAVPVVMEEADSTPVLPRVETEPARLVSHHLFRMQTGLLFGPAATAVNQARRTRLVTVASAQADITHLVAAGAGVQL